MSLISSLKIGYYVLSGRRPWSRGYSDWKWTLINRTLNSTDMMERFRLSAPLPQGYGYGLDERVVEYPWVLSRISPGKANVLDAGSTFNYSTIIQAPVLSEKKITIVTLMPEDRCFYHAGVSYLFEDLRQLPIKEGIFDIVVSISTLEHIGMDNTAIYGSSVEFLEDKKNDFEIAVRELRRVLRPDGLFLATVPTGKYRSFGWFQIFDAALIKKTIDVFDPKEFETRYYRYTNAGWNISDEDSCSGEEYFDVHLRQPRQADNAAAARAVCCLAMRK